MAGSERQEYIDGAPYLPADWEIDGDAIYIDADAHESEVEQRIREWVTVMCRVGGTIAAVADREEIAPNIYVHKGIALRWDSYGPARKLPQEPEPEPEPREAPKRERPNGEVKAGLRKKVFKRDNYQCVECGSKQDLTLDHILPQSRGGKHSFNNLQTMCRDCNEDKADRLVHPRNEERKTSSEASPPTPEDDEGLEPAGGTVVDPDPENAHVRPDVERDPALVFAGDPED